MRRKPMSSEDRISLSIGQFMGVCLSAQEHEDLYGDDIDNLDGGAAEEGGDDHYDAAKLLRRLLRATGVEVGAPTDPELTMLAAKKISEIRRKAQGTKSGAASNNQTNPLIPKGGAEIEPGFHGSLDRLHTEREQLVLAKREVDIALALAPAPSLTTEAESRIVSSLSRMMGAEPEHGGVSLGMEDMTDEDRAVDLLVKYMPGVR